MTDAPRCGVCGLAHPHLTVCPFVAELEAREEYVTSGGRRRLVSRVTRTRYYRRDALFEALVAAQEPEDGSQAEAEGPQP